MFRYGFTYNGQRTSANRLFPRFCGRPNAPRQLYAQPASTEKLHPGTRPAYTIRRNNTKYDMHQEATSILLDNRSNYKLEVEPYLNINNEDERAGS